MCPLLWALAPPMPYTCDSQLSHVQSSPLILPIPAAHTSVEFRRAKILVSLLIPSICYLMNYGNDNINTRAVIQNEAVGTRNWSRTV